MIGWDPWIKQKVKRVWKIFDVFHNWTWQLFFYYTSLFSASSLKLGSASLFSSTFWFHRAWEEKIILNRWLKLKNVETKRLKYIIKNSINAWGTLSFYNLSIFLQPITKMSIISSQLSFSNYSLSLYLYAYSSIVIMDEWEFLQLTYYVLGIYFTFWQHFIKLETQCCFTESWKKVLVYIHPIITN